MQLLSLLKSKIHRATVTDANVDYVGSIAMDRDLMVRTNIRQNERVHVWNVTTGARVETYAIEAEEGSGVIALNGAAAHRFRPGDIVIIAAFCWTDEPLQPKMILVDGQNRFVSNLHAEPALTLAEV
jgi:aspartate 1-decarboxylase